MKHMSWLLLIMTGWLNAGPVITFFFRNYPTTKERADQLSSKFKKPNAIAKRSLEGLTNNILTDGIVITYFGFLQISGPNGQVVFPRKQSSTLLNIVVTNKITPIMMFSNTVSHWELEPGTPKSVYRAELTQDPQTKLWYWNLEESALEEDNIIPSANSIIIIAKPKNIYIPTGITLAKEDANLILPDMYVQKSIKTTQNALYMLNLAPFFRPVDILYQKHPKSYNTLVKEY